MSRYKQTREAKDFLLATTYIKLNGYATSPEYTENLRRVILLNGLYTADYRTDPGKWITTNFQWWEIFCNVVFEGRKYYNILEPYPEYETNAIRTLNNFQILRTYYNMKMVLESGWRTEQYNASLPGSSPTSKHLVALAGDLKPARFIPRQELIKTALEKTEFKGFGIMVYNMHMDIRPKYTTWTY